jgi:ABC-type amino acid transport substrate-binding protein
LALQDSNAANGAKEQPCHYEVVSWRDNGVLSLKEDNSRGILPEIYAAISSSQDCKLTNTHLPLSRLFAYMAERKLEASVFVTPYGKTPQDTLTEFPSHIKSSTTMGKIQHTTPPLFTTRVGFFSRLNFDGRLETQADIRSYQIGAAQAAVLSPESYKYYSGFTFSPVGFNRVSSGLKALAAGRVDLFYLNYPLFYPVARELGINNLGVAKELHPTTFQLVFYGKISPTDAAAIDAAIVQLKESGDMQQIIQRHSDLSSYIW